MSKKHSRLPVAHAFGPAYGKWLDMLENYEDYLADRIPLRRLKAFTYNHEVFDFTLASPTPTEGVVQSLADDSYQNLFKILKQFKIFSKSFQNPHNPQNLFKFVSNLVKIFKILKILKIFSICSQNLHFFSKP